MRHRINILLANIYALNGFSKLSVDLSLHFLLLFHQDWLKNLSLVVLAKDIFRSGSLPRILDVRVVSQIRNERSIGV